MTTPQVPAAARRALAWAGGRGARWPRRCGRWAALGVGAVALGAALFVAWPLPRDLLVPTSETVVRLLDREGRPLREARRDGAGRAVPLPQGPLPPLVVQAFVAAEDQRFFGHWGVDPRAVARAARDAARARRVVSGASTITQQLARRLVPRSRTPWGKAKEMLWALRLTAHLPRERIMREYLDRVALGGDVVGVETAAEEYFRRPAAGLSRAQAALVAGVASSPARFDPRRRRADAIARMRRVLERMRVLGFVDDAEARAAADEPLDFAAPQRVFRAPHFAARIVGSLEERGLGAAAEVETTLDPRVQEAAERAIREELSGLAERGVGEAAAIVVDNATAEVLAYAGSADFFDAASGQNDGVRALRQPGSALKPFAYGLALASGMTAAEIIPDVESRFETPAGDFQPRNYDRRLHGPVRLRAALANSYNIPAVRVCSRIGPERLLATLRAAGFDSLDKDAGHYGVGLVLGDGEVSLYDLARAYAGLARGGVVAPLVEVRAARDARGLAIEPRGSFAPRRFLPADATALLTDILSDEAARAPAFGLDNALRLPFPVAAKTGTSRAHVDNWTVGFTRERTVAVWVGNFGGEPMGEVSGITGAGPIFRRVMIAAMSGVAPAPLVERGRFAHAAICPLSGKLAGPGCPGSIDEIFLPGTTPRETCPMHRPGRGGAKTLVMGRFATWARGEGLQDERSGAGERAAEGGAASRLLVPGNGDEYFIDPTLPSRDQSIPVRIEPKAGARLVEVRVDGRVALRLEAPFLGRIAAARGEHRLELWDEGASRAADAASFRVR